MGIVGVAGLGSGEGMPVSCHNPAGRGKSRDVNASYLGAVANSSLWKTHLLPEEVSSLAAKASLYIEIAD